MKPIKRRGRMHRLGKRPQGQAMVEYIFCTMVLAIFVWYALIGGSTDPATGQGGRWETDAVGVTGRLVDERFPTADKAPGLVQSLHKKQEDFRSAIYNP